MRNPTFILGCLFNPRHLVFGTRNIARASTLVVFCDIHKKKIKEHYLQKLIHQFNICIIYLSNQFYYFNCMSFLRVNANLPPVGKVYLGKYYKIFREI